MKKLITITITSLTMICFAHAEQINLGNYFSIDLPDSWQSGVEGMTVHNPDDYCVYSAHGRETSIVIAVLNLPTEQTRSISFEEFQNYTEVDMLTLVELNQTTGYSAPKIRKAEINGIPMLVVQKTATDGSNMRSLKLELWPAGKHFVVEFFYYKENYRLVNKIIDTMKLRVPPPAIVAPPTADAGIAGTI
jgi:hypothetical protein